MTASVADDQRWFVEHQVRRLCARRSAEADIVRRDRTDRAAGCRAQSQGAWPDRSAAADRCGRSFAGRGASDRLARKTHRAEIDCRDWSSDRAWRAEPLAVAIGDAGIDRRAKANQPVGPEPSAGRDQLDRGVRAPVSRIAASGVLRHGIPSRFAARRADAAGSAPARSGGRSALRVSRAVVHVFAARTGAHRRAGRGKWPRDPGPLGRRREPRGSPRRPLHRHDDGVHANRRPGDGHAMRRSSIRACSSI